MNGEFKYELEMRQDEERIARYFDNLPLFMDLPGENEAIFERIAKNSNEKVKLYDDLRHITPEYTAASEDEEELSRADRAVFRPDEYEMLDIIDKISLLYSERFAVSQDDARTAKILIILCQSSKTLARISDLLYTEETDIELRTALTKRVLHDLNDLSGFIRDFESHVQDCPVAVETDLLHIIRSKILNILFELKKN